MSSSSTVATNTGISVDLIGKSGKFRYKLGAEATSPWVSVELDRIREVDATGKTVTAIQNIASTQDVSWNIKQSTTELGTIAAKVSYVTNFKVNGYAPQLAVDVYLFLAAGNYNDLGETKAAEVGDMKLGFSVTGWPFANVATNKLVVGFRIKSQNDADVPKANDSGIFEHTIGSVKVISSNRTSLDKTVVTEKVAISVAQDVIEYTFPAFVTQMEYDPVFKATKERPSILPLVGALVLGYLMFGT